MRTMYAVRAHARGGPEALTYEEAPRPEPRVGEALIRVHAAGITPTELGWDETWVDRAGHPRVPTIPSHEVAGVVEAVGHGVVHVSVGDAVYGFAAGSFAEYALAREDRLAPKPSKLTFEVTAADGEDEQRLQVSLPVYVEVRHTGVRFPPKQLGQAILASS